MRSIIVVARETFLLLRRDKMYLPAIVIGVAFIMLANLASDWSIEDFTKILFDIGAVGFHLVGAVVALFWGTKTITDSRQSGALEVQLSLPIGRPQWLIGKFTGLCLSLLSLGVVLTICWGFFMYFNRFGIMTSKQVMVFALLMLNWIVIAAVSVFFASFCSQTVALFNATALWVAGLASRSVAETISPQTPELTAKSVKFVAQFWNLQIFNLADFVNPSTIATFPPARELAWRGLYGLSLVVLLLSVACVIFSRRDLIA